MTKMTITQAIRLNPILPMYFFHSRHGHWQVVRVLILFLNTTRITLPDYSIRIRTHNHLVRKRTLNHLAKLVKWLSCVVSTYLYGAFDCMFLSCHVRVSA